MSGDSGSILILTIFYSFLALSLVVVVTGATSLYLERKKLFTLADGAALSAAEAFAIVDVRLTPDGPRATLATQDVRGAARAYLDVAPTDDFTALEIVDAVTPDGRSAEVTLASTWRPPIVSVLLPDGVRVEVTSRARAVLD